MNFCKRIVFFLAIALLMVACKKDWLEAKPDKSLVVPKTIKDFQALLDNSNSTFNQAVPFNMQSIFLGEMGADEFYLDDQGYASLNNQFERNLYRWEEDAYGDAQTMTDWNNPYKRIFYTNIVLDSIDGIIPKANEVHDWKNVKGTAFFFRAFNYYDLAQVFCKAYYPNSASTDLGLPLRLTSDMNEPSVRSKVSETYDQIISDLIQAAELLPVAAPATDPADRTNRSRPTKAAVYALLARTYLLMEEYDNALENADKCLQLYSSLIEYSTRPNSTTPFPRFNAEVIWHCTNNGYSIGTALIVDSVLFNSYGPDDLRKNLFFRTVSTVNGPALKPKGGYNQLAANIRFSGLATDEVYLIRAECHARKNNVSAAMTDLNNLLRTRWTEATYIDQSAANADEALDIIISERRKELCFRSLRWADIRRLNKEARLAVTLTRVIDGQTYTLEPNDERYVLPIPDVVVRLGGIEQNPR